MKLKMVNPKTKEIIEGEFDNQHIILHNTIKGCLEDQFPCGDITDIIIDPIKKEFSLGFVCEKKFYTFIISEGEIE